MPHSLHIHTTHTHLYVYIRIIYTCMYSCVLILLVTTCVAYAGVIAGLGRQYALHSSHIHKVEFTEDDEHVLVASADGVVSQWRLLRHKAGVCVRGRERTREGALTCSSLLQWRLFRRKAGVCVGERERGRERENKRGCTSVQL